MTAVETTEVTLHAPSVDAYVTTEVERTPLVKRIDDETYARLRSDARTGLAPFCDPSGALALPFEIHCIRARTRSAQSGVGSMRSSSPLHPGHRGPLRSAPHPTQHLTSRIMISSGSSTSGIVDPACPAAHPACGRRAAGRT